MRKSYLKLTPLLLLLSIQLAFGQVRITGTVTSLEGSETLPGVNVVEKGTTNGTITDLDGNYVISVAPGSTLVFSSVGYITEEVVLGGQTTLNIVLSPDIKQLEELVVVGYGVQAKRDVTGAITSVNAESIERRQAVNIFDAIQGSAPGVNITSSSGAPGASNAIQIRGASTFSDSGVQPLFVVDNVIVSTIDNINPNDIKSVEILKDAASSAIYGAKSANGVIIITTKSGEAGKPKIDVRYLRSYSSIANKIPQVNAFEQVLNSKRGPVLEKFGSDDDSVGLQKSTNYFYQDLLTQTAVRNDLNLGISGGSDKLRYLASLGYIGDEGIMITSYNNKLSGRFNVDFNVTDKLKWTSRINLSHSKTNSINSSSIFQGAMRRDPNMILWYPDGSFAPYYAMGGRKNPVQELYVRDDLDQRFQGVVYQGLEFKFNKNLLLQTNLTGDFSLRREMEFSSKELAGEADGTNSGSDRASWSQKYQGDAYLNYNKTFGGDHTLNLMAGSSIETLRGEYLYVYAENFVSESVRTMNIGQLTGSTRTTASDYAAVGFFGRASYNYKGKYMFNSNARYDGSSKFGVNNRWGFFPSASIGWRFSDEPFMDWSNEWLSDAKFRVSWGITGNDAIGYYDSRLRFTAGEAAYNGYIAVIPVATYGNPDLHWEETAQTNFGLDMDLFEGRVNLTADYYIKETTDLLREMNLPLTTGYSEIMVNLASLENKGVELALSVYPIRTKDLTWQTTVNWWKNDNKITDLARDGYIESSRYFVETGYPAGLFYGYKNLGIYQYDLSNAYTDDYKTRLTPVLERDDNGNVIIGLDGQPTLINYTLPDGSVYEGEVKQLTKNGVVVSGGDVIWENMPNSEGVLDGKIDDNDRTILGEANPDWFGSWSNVINYKNFNLSFNFYASIGGLVNNDLKRYYTSWGGNTHMQHPDYIRTGWKYQGQITDWYAVNTRDRKTGDRTTQLSDFYLEDGSFIRLRNVRLSYNLEQNLLDRISFIKGLTAYVYGNNLATWTNYSGYDPEVGGGVLTPRHDSGAYPRKREIGLGVNVNF